MNAMMNPIPVGQWIDSLTNWLTRHLSGLFYLLQVFGDFLMNHMSQLLLAIPPLLFIALATVSVYFVSRKKWGFTAFTLLGLLFIYNQGLWNPLMETLTLVTISSLVSILIGVPLGILAAKSDTAQAIIQPILDLMQTMPGFVYLIPAVAFFGIGRVPGVFASVIFALPPTVRMTNLGIRQVSTELVEAAESFGSTSKQQLFDLELPLAKSTIFAGINQTIMLALSMVVIGSMIGAPGLGRGVLTALQRADIGSGFVNGLSLVILAIILDRVTQNLNRPITEQSRANKKRRRYIIGGVVSALVISLIASSILGGNNNKQVSLSYVTWDTEVASTHVVATILEEMGYDVTLTPLDNAVMWEAVATGEADAMVGAWLPATHAAQFDQYGDKMDDLGANLVGARIGLVVPEYMQVDSIEELTNQANREIVAIEPGAGVVMAAQNAQESYSNLSDWTVETSSTGAMTVALQQAIESNQEIVVTGWSPHWKFAAYDLKYLEDPQESFGGEESIHTMARLGLKDDLPEVYQLLDAFNWTLDDMEHVMLEINDGKDPYDAAKDWVDAHRDEVEQWKP